MLSANDQFDGLDDYEGSSTTSSAPWTSDDDNALRIAVSRFDKHPMAVIASQAFPNGAHSVMDCVNRWAIIGGQPKPTTKGAWSTAEDDQLVSLVAELGTDKWVAVGKRMATRTGKQCRERYHNHLDPSSTSPLRR